MIWVSEAINDEGSQTKTKSGPTGDERLTVMIEKEDDHPPVTTLTGNVDQAALHGLLRRLYSQGLPLISVIWIEPGQDEELDVKQSVRQTT